MKKGWVECKVRFPTTVDMANAEAYRFTSMTLYNSDPTIDFDDISLRYYNPNTFFHELHVSPSRRRRRGDAGSAAHDGRDSSSAMGARATAPPVTSYFEPVRGFSSLARRRAALQISRAALQISPTEVVAAPYQTEGRPELEA